MEKVSVTLTVFFDDPFWAGLFEWQGKEGYQAAKVVFGSEPKDYEVLDMVLRHYAVLPRSKGVFCTENLEKKINPKRMQRMIQKATSQRGIGTKAQQALQAQRELCKQEKRAERRREKAEEEKENFLRRQKKKREKHRGH